MFAQGVSIQEKSMLKNMRYAFGKDTYYTNRT